MTQHTAILIFANSSTKEAQNKGFHKSEELFKNLNNLVIKKAKRSNLPYFIINENQQIGNSFGERFANAIQSIYNKGFNNVISIGNDSPQLKVSHLLKANQNLKANKFVLGPSKNGGFYLLGLNKADFNYNNFKNLAWQTNTIQKAFLKHFKTLKTEIRLELLKDINTKKDLYYFLNSYKFIHHITRRLIVAILNKIVNHFTQYSLAVKHFTDGVNFNKGSPTLL